MKVYINISVDELPQGGPISNLEYQITNKLSEIEAILEALEHKQKEYLSQADLLRSFSMPKATLGS